MKIADLIRRRKKRKEKKDGVVEILKSDTSVQNEKGGNESSLLHLQ